MSRQLAVERVAEVEARSVGLRKELGLVDLVLMQIMYVVGSAWVGTAAKLGSSHTVFWLLATAGFGWYVRNIANYNVLYRSVATSITLLVWMYLMSLIALLGCEFNAEYERVMTAPTTLV